MVTSTIKGKSYGCSLFNLWRTVGCLSPLARRYFRDRPERRRSERVAKLATLTKTLERYRKEFRAVGWEFGQEVINVVRCPCCPKDAKPNPDRAHTKAALEELLGDDEDGLAATFEDYRL